MKNFLKNLALIALILTVAAPAFSKNLKTNKDGTLDVELWYGAAVTEAGPPPADWKALKIIKDKFGVNLKISMLPSAEADQNQKINAAGAANSLPDVFMLGDQIYDVIYQNGLLARVDEMYKMMPNRTKKLYDAASIAHSTIGEGKAKGSYRLDQPGSIVRNEGVLIRNDWLKKLGLSVPKTTDEFLNVMKAFTNNDPDGNGKADTYGFGGYLELSATNDGLGRRFDPIVGAFGVAGTWNLTAKNAGLNVRKPEYFEAMQYVKQIIDAGAIDPNWLSYKKDDFRAAWKQGKFGIFREQNAAGFSESNYKAFDNNFPEGELIVINPPVGPKGYSSCGTYSQSYRGYAISAKVNNKDKAKVKQNGKWVSKTKMRLIAEVFEWMSDESKDGGYFLLGFGEEGVNYKLVNGAISTANLPDPSKAWTKSEMQPYTQLRNIVYYNSDVELGARYPTYKAPKSGKTLSALKALREMQSKPWTACSGQDKMPKPNADITRFYEQGVVEFLTGKRQLTKANWDAWVAEFDKLGGKAWEDEGIAYAKANRLLK